MESVKISPKKCKIAMALAGHHTTLRVVGQQKTRSCGACKKLERLVMQCQQVAQYIEYCVAFKIY